MDCFQETMPGSSVAGHEDVATLIQIVCPLHTICL